MSDFMIEKLSEIDLSTVVVVLVFLYIVYQFLAPLFKKLKDAIIKKYKKDTKDDNIAELVGIHDKKIKEYAENRVHDREQSFQIQKELVDSISSLNERIDKLAELQQIQYNEALERENKRVRAELKDRIGQSYRYYHERGEWNLMEKESLEDLISEYEAAGGDNSFVHDVVVKDMYSWIMKDCNYKPKVKSFE